MPPGVTGNPCLEYMKYVVMPWCGKFGVSVPGTTTETRIVDYDELEKDSCGSCRETSSPRSPGINAVLQPVPTIS